MNNSALTVLPLVMALAASAFATPAITGVTAYPHHPWDGKVDLSYTLPETIVTNLTTYTLNGKKVSRDKVPADLLKPFFDDGSDYSEVLSFPPKSK